MAHRDDVSRVLVCCLECGSAYAARQWPDGSIKLIGQDRCSCGSTEFSIIDDTDDSDSTTASGWPTVHFSDRLVSRLRRSTATDCHRSATV